MTEAEWLAAEDPVPMLEWLAEPDDSPPASRFGLASGRKLRLFACACCRQVWPLLPDARSRRAVEAAELYADGLATRDDLDRAWNTSLDAPRSPGAVAAGLVAIEGHLPGRMPTILACLAGAGASGGAALLRDVFGNPFRPVVCRTTGHPLGTDTAMARADGTLAGCDCRWLTPTVLRLARGVYAGRDFGAMPVLADALEEAGADDGPLLWHLRGQYETAPEGWYPTGPHVRGCWALDLVLGKS